MPMKNLLTNVSLAAILLAPAHAADSPRQRLTADFGWKFSQDDIAGAEKPDFNDSAWRTLNLPHDWSIEGSYDQSAAAGGGGGYLPTGVGWYRRSFVAPESWRGKQVYVEFDGVYKNSDVWLNGQSIGHRPFGYIGFEYDLTPHLKFGQTNVLAVRVDNSQQPNSRWYSGSGIYRHTWITVTDPAHVAHWGTYVTTRLKSRSLAAVQVRTQIQNDSRDRRDITLVNEVLDAASRTFAKDQSKTNLAPGARIEITHAIEVPEPNLWSLNTPYLYTLRTQVKAGEQVIDEYLTPFGIRELRYDVDKGFFLNEQPVKMQGMCLHHDAGSVGAAVPIGVWERRLQLLKDMGCNAIRASHNPPAPEFLDLCDRMGFLVMDESFDEWKSSKVRQGGYAKYFDEWSQRDLTAMLHRDRNHPSVVMWSVGNEIGEQTQARGADVLRPLVETCHREDPTRPVTAGCDNIFTDRASATPEFLNLLDIVGYNYVDRWGSRRETIYGEDRHAYPSRKVVGTESSVVGSRGDYSLTGGFGPPGAKRPPNYTLSMIRTEQLWKFIKVHDYVIGDFGWTGIDYLGESRWPGKLAASGMLDTCGFPKDNYYFYQSLWSTNLMLHVLPHWNWKGREGEVIPVVCYTSCDTVELFLNGKSFGVKSIEFPRQGTAGGWNSYARPQQPTGSTADLHLTWDVPYEPGTLKAVGYKFGNKACEEEVRTTGEPVSLTIESDRKSLLADGRAVAHLTVRIVDARGDVVPGTTNRIAIDVQGAASLIGVDNGNPTDHDSYKEPQRQAYRGRVLAILQSTRNPGAVRVKVHAEGLTDATVELKTQAPGEKEPALP
jgi:beta-galactosidase